MTHKSDTSTLGGTGEETDLDITFTEVVSVLVEGIPSSFTAGIAVLLNTIEDVS